MLAETIQLEKLRQKIEDMDYEAASRSDYLDRGKRSSSEAKRVQAELDSLTRQSKESKAELSQLIAHVRSQKPEAFAEWVAFHEDILQRIIAEAPTGTMAGARRNVATETLQKWEKVRAGEEHFVFINYYFLKDYKAHVRTVLGKTKAWWQFWK